MTAYTPVPRKPVASDVNMTTIPGPQNENIAPSTKLSSDAPLATEPSITTPAKRSPWSAIGTRGLVLIIIGSGVILVACGVLASFWVSSRKAADGKKLPSFWQAIVDRGNTTLVATICAAAIRTSVALQMSLITAALAAVIIETCGISLASAAGLSIIRASGSGPIDLITLGGSRLLRQSRGQLLAAVSVIAVILILQSAVLSTVLLSDFTDTVITGSPREFDIAVDVPYPDFDFLTTGARWTNIPASSWRFAESEDGADPEAKNQTYDTGDTFVAMLPFTDAAFRTNILQYTGPASVSNTRTVCYAPEDEDLTDITIVGRPDKYALDTINGTFNMLPIDEPLGLPRRNAKDDAQQMKQEVYFECEVISDYDAAKNGGWPVTICMGWMRWTAGHFQMMPLIVIDARKYGDTTSELYYPTEDVVYPVRGRKTDDSSVWTSIFSEKLDRDVLQLSVCMSLVGYMTANVTMEGRMSATGPEPEAFWDQGAHSRDPGWDAEALSRQATGLDADGAALSLEQRGLLRLSSQRNIWEDFFDSLTSTSFIVIETWNPPHKTEIMTDNMMKPAGFYLLNSTESKFDHEWAPHRIYSSEFQDVLQRTGSLPLAMRSFLTRLWQTHYASYVRGSSGTHNVTAVFAVTALLPSRLKGLAMVLSFVLLHFMLLSLTMVLFLRMTSVSRLWHPWQAVAHVVTPDTDDVLRVADAMSDRKTREGMKIGESGTASYRVAYSTSKERYQLLPTQLGAGSPMLHGRRKAAEADSQERA